MTQESTQQYLVWFMLVIMLAVVLLILLSGSCVKQYTETIPLFPMSKFALLNSVNKLQPVNTLKSNVIMSYRPQPEARISDIHHISYVTWSLITILAHFLTFFT